MTSPPAESGFTRIANLRPTQFTVGFREVAQKRLRLRSRMRKAGVGRASIPVAPVVLGPGGAVYLVDRHHLACAMKDEGLQEVLTRQIADYSALAPADLWPTLETKGWCRPYDAAGRRRPAAEIPHTLAALLDDPLRSLASALRRAGGFTKGAAPFSEFAWADFLREQISSEVVTEDFDGALERALFLARTRAARRLPGWRPDPFTSANIPLAPPHAVR